MVLINNLNILIYFDFVYRNYFNILFFLFIHINNMKEILYLII